jgi:hypothetical protein
MHKLKHGEREKQKRKGKGAHSHLLNPPTASLSPWSNLPLCVKTRNDFGAKSMSHRSVISTLSTIGLFFLPTKTFDVQIPGS